MTAAPLFRNPTRKALLGRTLLAGIAAVALTAAGFGFAQGFGGDASAIAKGGARWSDAFGEMNPPHLTPSAEALKDDRLDAAGCAEADWPYIGEACLVAAEGTEFRTASRTVTIEHRIEAENTSILTRMPVEEVALQ